MAEHDTASSLHWRGLFHAIRAHPPLPLLIVVLAFIPVLSGLKMGLGPLAIGAAFSLWFAERYAPYDSEALVGKRLKVAGLMVATLVLWMIFQLLPASLLGHAHPIWLSVEDATGSMSWQPSVLDKTSQINAIFWLLVICSFSLAATLTAVERYSAYVLTTTISAICALWSVASLLSLATEWSSRGVLRVVLDPQNAGGIAGLVGAVLIAADLLSRIGRSGRVTILGQTASRRVSPTKFIVLLLALAACIASAINLPGSVAALAAAGSVLVVVLILRGSRFGMLERIFGLLVVASITAAVAGTLKEKPDLSAIFDANSNPEIQALLTDTPLTGLGAGSAAGVRRIYLDDDRLWMPSAFTSLAGEFGLPAALAGLSALLVIAALLANSAISRFRDWQFAAGGSAAATALLVVSFYSDAPHSKQSLFFLFFVFAIGLAQARGRSMEAS